MKFILYLLAMLALVYCATGQKTDEPAPADPQKMELVRDELRARHMLRRHEKGEVSLSPEELQRYRDIVAKGNERRAKDGDGSSKRKEIVVRDLPLGVMVAALEKKCGLTIEITERAKARKVSFEISKSSSAEDFTTQLGAALAKAGILMTIDGSRAKLDASDDQSSIKGANQSVQRNASAKPVLVATSLVRRC